MISEGSFSVQYIQQQTACPQFLEALQSMIGQQVAIQTGMHVQQGILTAAFPDLVVLEVCQVPFYYRLEEIIWVSPVLMNHRG